MPCSGLRDIPPRPRSATRSRLAHLRVDAAVEEVDRLRPDRLVHRVPLSAFGGKGSRTDHAGFRARATRHPVRAAGRPWRCSPRRGTRGSGWCRSDGRIARWPARTHRRVGRRRSCPCSAPSRRVRGPVRRHDAEPRCRHRQLMRSSQPNICHPTFDLSGSALVLGVLHRCVRSREHERLMPVWEPHQVRRRAVHAPHLDDLRRVVLLANRVAAHVQPVTHHRAHRVSFQRRCPQVVIGTSLRLLRPEVFAVTVLGSVGAVGRRRVRRIGLGGVPMARCHPLSPPILTGLWAKTPCPHQDRAPSMPSGGCGSSRSRV